MPIPSSRLLLWVAAIVVPFSTVAGMIPAAAPFCWVVLAVFALLTVVDALRSLRFFDGVSVTAADTIRFSKDRPGDLALVLSQPADGDRTFIIGLSLPREFETPTESQVVSVPGGGRPSALRWDCTPRRRGTYVLSRCHLEVASPWGLWGMRTELSLHSELRVYPDLRPERKEVAALFLRRETIGAQARRQVGKGRDFEKLREYIPSDTYEDIHWKATAKLGRPVTKVFQVERSQEIYVMVDASRLSAREVIDPAAGENGPRVSMLERYVNAALVLGWAAERQGDLFGLTTFGDRVVDFVRAANGKAHYSRCRDTIHALQASAVTPDFEELFSFLRLRLRRRSLLLFLTSLDDPLLAESFAAHVQLIARQHLVLVGLMQPPGVGPLFTGPEVTSTGDVYQNLAGQIRWRRLLELGASLRQQGVHFTLLQNEHLCAEVVSNYLETRRRQLL